MNILGVSGYYHDSAAALLCDGEIVAAAQEERFTRKKGDEAFPGEAVRYCMAEASLKLDDIDRIAFYDKPLLTFDRLLETNIAFAPRGYLSFVKSIPVWVKQKLLLQRELVGEINRLDLGTIKSDRLRFAHHHHSHAASAFYPSPFESAAVLVMDGVGEWATTSLGCGRGTKLTLNKEIRFPHSIGMLYSAFTYYLGFRVNDGEYKIMGLAPYGEPIYTDRIYDRLIDLKDDGSFWLDMHYFNYCTGLTMTNDAFAQIFDGVPRRNPDAPLEQRDMDIARSVQAVTEEIILRLARTLHNDTGEDRLVMAGGVALNCVANGRLKREGPYSDIWIQPAAGDAGGAIGAAFSSLYSEETMSRVHIGVDGMKGGYLGPEYDSREISNALDSFGATYEELDEDNLFRTVAEILVEGGIVGWFQGRMEFGPRALGNRSILGDARSPTMQKMLNLKIKYRESFRPFAPAVLREDVSEYFELDDDSPYMLIVASVRPDRRREQTIEEAGLTGVDRLNVVRSDIPAVTHVDNSARIQTVTPDTNSRFYNLLREFKAQTGNGLLVNTSFNVRDEPIVCSPEDAYRCFMSTEMDALAIGKFLLRKYQQ
ncbi:MAG: Decarbamoylnovobiocin carbamoyltransferase [Alphaproteobacteria bacterium MarineAlpha11_Bin1]|nr:MAG: Decarbamoylnovobiocin carbamoyltransferase [Alphaproteobacteria bacterium MarineAlpha11_Bin1]|tara:strand:+ start:3599 stop:5389 length:1791 start_codon:yes stop_codon:yes gene_type:complete